MGFLNKIGSLLMGLGSFFFDYCRTEAARLIKAIGPVAREVAIEVERRSAGRMSGKEKFELVKTILIERLIALGIAYTTSTLHTAIEMAADFVRDYGHEIKRHGGSG